MLFSYFWQSDAWQNIIYVLILKLCKAYIFLMIVLSFLSLCINTDKCTILFPYISKIKISLIITVNKKDKKQSKVY